VPVGQDREGPVADECRSTADCQGQRPRTVVQGCDGDGAAEGHDERDDGRQGQVATHGPRVGGTLVPAHDEGERRAFEQPGDGDGRSGGEPGPRAQPAVVVAEDHEERHHGRRATRPHEGAVEERLQRRLPVVEHEDQGGAEHPRHDEAGRIREEQAQHERDLGERHRLPPPSHAQLQDEGLGDGEQARQQPPGDVDGLGEVRRPMQQAAQGRGHGETDAEGQDTDGSPRGPTHRHSRGAGTTGDDGRSRTALTPSSLRRRSPERARMRAARTWRSLLSVIG